MFYGQQWSVCSGRISTVDPLTLIGLFRSPLQNVCKETVNFFQDGFKLFLMTWKMWKKETPYLKPRRQQSIQNSDNKSKWICTSVLWTSCHVPSSVCLKNSRKGSDLPNKSYSYRKTRTKINKLIYKNVVMSKWMWIIFLPSCPSFWLQFPAQWLDYPSLLLRQSVKQNDSWVSHGIASIWDEYEIFMLSQHTSTTTAHLLNINDKSVSLSERFLSFENKAEVTAVQTYKLPKNIWCAIV